MLRTIQATRYVLPLREGGSLPAIVEADDLGLYVVKFRGAGQGILALIAELIAGEIGRALGLRVPELVFAQIDPALARNEPDYEIRHLLKASSGLNLALDYLPGSTMFDPAARDTAPADEASLLVWFDAFVQNVDRTPRNANLLVWHRKLYPIDHGAALYFHHNWPTRPSVLEENIASPFAEIAQHILLPWATEIESAAALAHRRLTPEVLAAIVDLVPDEWLAAIPDAPDPADRRAGYLDYLTRRLAASSLFEQEALRARLI
ncbi:MAG: HipA family kinase [Acidobacteriaceae bacterium]